MARRPAVHEVVSSRRVAKPSGPNVHGVVANNPGRLLWVSGQLPTVPSTGRPVTGLIRVQAEAVFAQVRNIVQDAGFRLDEMTFCRIYLTDLKNLPIVDELYRKLFVGQTVPARTVLCVPPLPDGALILVEATASHAGEAAPAAPPPPDPYGYDDQPY